MKKLEEDSAPGIFSFPACRKLFKKLGETDAWVEATELSHRFFKNAADQSGNVVDFVKVVSEKFKICVNLGELDSLSRHLAQNYIVITYQSAEIFFDDFEKEYRILYQDPTAWDRNKKNELILTIQEISKRSKQADISPELVACYKYYKSIRTLTIHRDMDNANKALRSFEELKRTMGGTAGFFQSLSAPNPPSQLNFDDFICFSRAIKIIAEELCEMARPPKEHWQKILGTTRFKNITNNQERLQNAISGELRTLYGMDSITGDWIAREICGSLA